MCGFAGVVAPHGGSPSVDERTLVAMRDRLEHRGPDDAGLYLDGPVAMGHRRLAVIDPGPGGRQPMAAAGGHGVLVYNGELYNDADLRAELVREGVRFRTACDTETVLMALERWGPEAITRFRGMFALAWYDRRDGVLLLARDPLGIKPLYYTPPGVTAPGEVAFASEPAALLAHPAVSDEPDLGVVSAYLTTIRTTLGERTLYRDVRCVRPGGAVLVAATEGGTRVRAWTHWRGPRINTGGATDDAASRVRECVRTSIGAHLRSDAAWCSLLSGGIDSSIVAGEAVAALRRGEAEGRGAPTGSLRTWCAGAVDDPGGGDGNGDFAFARRVAARLGVEHHEAPVSAAAFLERWAWMVDRLRTPLSTPNEVAIYTVAERLRADGCVVTLSGEGADEVFGGYGPALDNAAVFVRNAALSGAGAGTAAAAITGGLFQLASNAWAAPNIKPLILHDAVWRGVEQDAALQAFYAEELAAAIDECGESTDPLEPHLRMHRRINLPGLLGRLDTATMLASVEGRTPLADRVVTELAESLPISCKYAPAEGLPASSTPATSTKMVLRRAFEDAVPADVLVRPKASFPLPFQSWMAGAIDVIRRSSFARELFRDEAIEQVCADPQRHWNLAWPMINLAWWRDADISCRAAAAQGQVCIPVKNSPRKSK